MDDQSKYPKYAWIQLDLERRADKDFRPESYRPLRGVNEEIIVLEKISTASNWRQRKSLILKDVYHSMEVLISDAYSDSCTSLATLKPTEILDVQIEPTEREWPASWQSFLIQNNLFETAPDGNRRPIRKVPYDFSYVFKTIDNKTRTLKIEDWELGALYWRCIRKTEGDEIEATRLVKKKYLSLARNDIYFFLGTTLKYHQMHAPNPFIIIGVFYPPIDPQIYLFE